MRKGRALAPHIHVFLGNLGSRAEQVSSRLWSLPALTIGLGSTTGAFAPLRGDILSNKPISKLDQAAILQAKGVTTPRTAKFDPKASYDPEVWGEFVLVKPAPLVLTSDGNHVRMMRTRRLDEIATPQQMAQLLGTSAPALVQSFIDTGPRPECWRVLTLFGHPLYCMRTVSPIERPPLTAPDDVIENASVVSKHIDWNGAYDFSEILFLVSDPEIVAFAREIAACFPRIPLLGVDILRDQATGKLFALEINAGGNVWHFSSRGSQSGRAAVGREDRIAQFGAWDVAARALLEVSETRAR